MTLRSYSVVYWGYEYEIISPIDIPLVTSDKGFFALPCCHWPSIRVGLGVHHRNTPLFGQEPAEGSTGHFLIVFRVLLSLVLM